jgi:predicted nucleic acid-binding protein
MIVLDTNVIFAYYFAYYDRDDQWHEPVCTLLKSELGKLILPGSVIPKVDYLLGRRLGSKARHAFFEDVMTGFFTLQDIPFALYTRIQEIDLRYAQMELGFVDSSIMALSEWLNCQRIATLDHRHFAAVARELQFQLLPLNTIKKQPG